MATPTSMTSTVTATNLSNHEKVAIVLASLEDEVAASILQQLDPEIATQVITDIRDLGIIPGSVREQVLHDCLTGIEEMRKSVRGGESRAAAVLARAVGEKRAAALLGEGKTNDRFPFAALAEASAEQIAGALGREQPGLIGTVLRYLPAKTAADVLGLLPSQVRKQAAVFMCRSNRPNEEAIRHIEAFLSSKIDPENRKTRRADDSADKIGTMANILQHVDRSVEEELLEAIDGFSAQIGSEIKDRLFTFEDIVRLGDADVRKILQEVDTNSLAVSLRGSSIDVREKIFNNMSKRAAAGLKEEMEFTPKMRVSEVEAKQKEIVAVIRRLDGEGQISLGQGGKDEYV
jgi:flagellar motor switch protein FliG